MKQGELEKRIMDFSWKSYFVGVTSEEMVFATSMFSDVSDRLV
jgi:hypothetical protein